MQRITNLTEAMAYIAGCEHYPFFAVDLFCGAGGETEGLEEAVTGGRKCAKVFACVNHDPTAIESHSANHPDTLHYVEDIRTLDTSGLRELAAAVRKHHTASKIILHASVECTNFSNAKGGLPRNPDSRTLAEHLFRYIEAIDPDYVTVENVREFQYWGGLDADGKPLSHDRGRCYVRWVNRVKKYGYDFESRILNSANYGAYTSRERFFGIFAKKGLPIRFPEATYAKNGEEGLFGSVKRWKAVSDVLDLEDEGESIFERSKPLVDATLRRIYAGLRKFTDRQFLVKHFSGDDAGKCQGLGRPAGTVTCKDHHSLVSLRFFDNQYGTGVATSIEQPCGALVGHPKQNLVTCLMVSGYGWPTYPLSRPCPTIVASQEKSPIYIVNAKDGILSDRTGDSAQMKELKRFCREKGIGDIRMRMLKVGELKRIMGFPEGYRLCGTLGQQKKYIGNAVEVNMARCLCEALTEGMLASA